MAGNIDPVLTIRVRYQLYVALSSAVISGIQVAGTRVWAFKLVLLGLDVESELAGDTAGTSCDCDGRPRATGVPGRERRDRGCSGRGALESDRPG